MRMFWHLGLGRELGLIFWTLAFLEASFGAYLGIWPLWIERLGAPVSIVGLVLGSSGIVRLAVLAPSALLAERFNRKRLIVVIRTAAVLGMLSAAVAQHWTHLFVMVVGGAIGELVFPLLQTHVATHAGERRIRAFTLIFTVGPSIALFISPLLSGLLVATWGLRAAFVLAALLSTISIVCFALTKRDLPSPTGHQAELSGGYRAAFAEAAIRRVLILQGVTVFILALGTSLAPNFLESTRGLEPARIATLGAGSAIGSMLFGVAVTRITSLQRNPIAAASIPVFATSIAFAIFITQGALGWIAFAFVLRGGLFSAWALYAAALGEIAPARYRARTFAMVEMLGGAAFSLAPIFAGRLFEVRASLPLMVASILGIVLLPILLISQRAAHRVEARDTYSSAQVPQTASLIVPLPDQE